MQLSTDVQMDLHRRMVRIRLFEEAAGKAGRGGTTARVPAPLRRRGSGRLRCVRGAERRRPHHLDAPRPRPPRRQRWRLRPDDGRADGQVDRLLQGQGRVDAHQRSRRSACSVRTASSAPVPHRGRRGVRQQVPQAGPGRRHVLRRRRHQHRRVPRGRQHGLRVEAARRVRVREQRVRRVHATKQDDGHHRHRRSCGRVRDARRDRRRHGRGRRARSRHRRSRPGPSWRRSVADRGEDLPVLQPPRHPEPRPEVPHRRRGRAMEARATRSSRSRSD